MYTYLRVNPNELSGTGQFKHVEFQAEDSMMLKTGQAS